MKASCWLSVSLSSWISRNWWWIYQSWQQRNALSIFNPGYRPTTNAIKIEKKWRRGRESLPWWPNCQLNKQYHIIKNIIWYKVWYKIATIIWTNHPVFSDLVPYSKKSHPSTHRNSTTSKKGAKGSGYCCCRQSHLRGLLKPSGKRITVGFIWFRI